MAAIDGEASIHTKATRRGSKSKWSATGSRRCGVRGAQGFYTPEVDVPEFCLPVGNNPVSTLVEPIASPLKANR